MIRPTSLFALMFVSKRAKESGFGSKAATLMAGLALAAVEAKTPVKAPMSSASVNSLASAAQSAHA